MHVSLILNFYFHTFLSISYITFRYWHST
jgi:hypothetical protein